MSDLEDSNQKTPEESASVGEQAGKPSDSATQQAAENVAKVAEGEKRESAPAAAVKSDEATKPQPKAAQPVDTPAAAAEPTATAAEKPAAAAEPTAAAAEKPAAHAKPAAAAKPAGAERPARAAKAAAPPDPRIEAAKETAEKIKAILVDELGEAAVEETGVAHLNPMVRVKREFWPDAVKLLKNHADWQLNYIECMAGTDYPDYIEVVIYIQSTNLGHFICLKTRTPRDKAQIPSIVSIHPGVNWEEREIFDLLGVHFTDHPDLRRIMMWEGFKGHPLRKDYSEWDGGEENGAH